MSFPPPTHQIHWRNLTNGRVGVGAQFDEARAREIADSLNEEFPDFEHQALPIGETPKFESDPNASATIIPFPEPEGRR